MTALKLTCDHAPATYAAMKGACSMARKPVLAMAPLALFVPLLGGCVTVNAPSEPIVIELNINITQEVIYRLAKDAGETIDENADIF